MTGQPPERPRSEPEIIPPDRAHEDDMRRAARMWFGDGASQRVYVARIGPFGAFFLAFAAGALSILLLIFILGAFLLWIPIVGLIVAGVILSSLLRGLLRRPR